MKPNNPKVLVLLLIIINPSDRSLAAFTIHSSSPKGEPALDTCFNRPGYRFIETHNLLPPLLRQRNRSIT